MGGALTNCHTTKTLDFGKSYFYGIKGNEKVYPNAQQTPVLSDNWALFDPQKE